MIVSEGKVWKMFISKAGTRVHRWCQEVGGGRDPDPGGWLRIWGRMNDDGYGDKYDGYDDGGR